MRTIMTIAICLILFQFSATPADAVMYKWVDQNGVVHFSDTPPESQEELETRETTTYTAPAPLPRKPKRRKAASTAVPEPASRKKGVASSRAKANQVEIFTTEWCGYCKKALALLRANGVPFKQHDIEKESGARKKMMALGGRGGVPFAVINGKKIYGYSEDTYRRVLGLVD